MLYDRRLGGGRSGDIFTSCWADRIARPWLLIAYNLFLTLTICLVTHWLSKAIVLAHPFICQFAEAAEVVFARYYANAFTPGHLAIIDRIAAHIADFQS